MQNRCRPHPNTAQNAYQKYQRSTSPSPSIELAFLLPRYSHPTLLDALDIKPSQVLLPRNSLISIKIDISSRAVEVDNIVSVLEKAARRIREAVGELGRSASDSTSVIDGAAFEEIGEVACHTVAERGGACLFTGEIVADLEGEGGDARGEGWGRAGCGSKNGGDDGDGELHFEGFVCGCLDWLWF